MFPELIPVPIKPVPVPPIVPDPPVSMEIAVGYPVIPWGEMGVIIWGYIHDDPRYAGYRNIVPGTAVKVRPIPATFMDPVPEPAIKIETRHIRYHIDISCSRNHHYIGRSGKCEGRQGNADVHVYPGFTNKRRADNEKQTNHK